MLVDDSGFCRGGSCILSRFWEGVRFPWSRIRLGVRLSEQSCSAEHGCRFGRDSDWRARETGLKAGCISIFSWGSLSFVVSNGGACGRDGNCGRLLEFVRGSGTQVLLDRDPSDILACFRNDREDDGG